jgi:hypothetical protein
MRAVGAACAELLALLKAGGFTGSAIDPAELNPPGAVWIQPQDIHDLDLAGGADLTVWLYLIAPNTDYVHSMTLLDDGLEGLLELLGESGIPLADADPPIDLKAAILLPDTASPLPAYRLAVDLEL